MNNLNIHQALLTCGERPLSDDQLKKLERDWNCAGTDSPTRLQRETPNIPTSAIAYWILNSSDFVSRFVPAEDAVRLTEILKAARAAFISECKPSPQAVKLANAFRKAQTAPEPDPFDGATFLGGNEDDGEGEDATHNEDDPAREEVTAQPANDVAF